MPLDLSHPALHLSVLPDDLYVLRYPGSTSIPTSLFAGHGFVSATRSAGCDEVSIVASEQAVEALGASQEKGGPWKAVRIVGPLEHSMVGVLSQFSAVLAKAAISIFALSTWDTDYILIKADQLDGAGKALTAEGWTVWRNLYTFPRFAVLPKHAPKAFIPLDNVFTKGRGFEFEDKENPAYSPLPPKNENPGPHRLVHGIITDLTRNSVTFVNAGPEGDFRGIADDESGAPADRIETIEFEYCVYALGGVLSSPSDVWGDLGRKQFPDRGTKLGGIEWLTRYNGGVAKVRDVLVVGGGALGIQFATDIKTFFPEKNVTLLHSRERLMRLYDKKLHDAVVKRCDELGIRLILGERVLEWPTDPEGEGTKVVKTNKGTELKADIVLPCIGTKPTIKFMANIAPEVIGSDGYIQVTDAMRVRTDGKARSETEANGLNGVADKINNLSINGDDRLDHMFAIGECVETISIRAGHVAFGMGSVAGRNILRMIEAANRGENVKLEPYQPLDHSRIKVTLGLTHQCVATPTSAVESEDGVEDLHAKLMWGLTGAADFPDDK